MPKQFLSLTSDYTLLQETIIRLSGLDQLAKPTLICNIAHRFLAAEQLRAVGLSARRILLEPIGRNTAPAVAVAALDAIASDPEAILLVLPSDHVILNVPSFHKAIRDGVRLAGQGKLVTYGLIPTEPKTGYGYIKQGDAIDTAGNVFRVERFVEKPNREIAWEYLNSGEYHWNSGIFMFKAERYLNELKRFSPGIYEKSRLSLDGAHFDLDFCWLEPKAFEQCPSDSIDYAIMEKTEEAVLIPVDMGWSDIGSWGALWEVVGKDAQGNVAQGNVFLKDVGNCYIRSDKEIVAALGIDDLIIIDTPDALLVAHMDKEQEVKEVFKKLM